MSTLLPLNGIFMLIVSGTAIAVMAYWWIATKGSWMDWPAGRSLMGLLLIIAVISGWAGLNTTILPSRYDGKILSYFALYAALEAALVVIGVTIRREMKRGAERARKKLQEKPHTGPVTVVVASENKEMPNDK
jgi:cation transport ATPase